MSEGLNSKSLSFSSIQEARMSEGLNLESLSFAPIEAL